LAISCPKCSSTIPPDRYNRPSSACPGCDSQLITAAFASLISGPSQTGSGQVLIDEDQASCFYHPNKTASVPCDNCGRFLCSLCDVDFGGKSICPACIENYGDNSSATSMDTERVLYDKLAMGLAIIPTFITQIVALFLAIKHWTSPITIPPRHPLRWRWIATVLIALAELWLLSMLVFGDF